MSTRGNIILVNGLVCDLDYQGVLSVEDIAKLVNAGKVIYNHSDSYPNGLGRLLNEYVNNKFKDTYNLYNYNLDEIRLNLAFWIMFNKEVHYQNRGYNSSVFSNHGVYLEDFISSDIEYLYIIDLSNCNLLMYTTKYDNDFDFVGYQYLDLSIFE